MTTHLRIIGICLLLLAGMHAAFPRYFNWRKQLSSLDLLHGQMFRTHTFFIAYVVGLMGALCYTSAEELVATPLGRKLCFGLMLFWGLRAVFQHFVYSPLLWRGKVFETVVHVVFSVFWVYMAVVFGWVAFG